MNENNKEVVLSVKDLRVNFATDHGYVQAVRGVSFDLYKGETLCIVGESGSGKSVSSKAIMGILAANGRIVGGSIIYEGEDLTKVSEEEFHRIRGHKIGMIFQDPLSSLNPIVKIGKQITEAMLINSSRLNKLFNDKVAKEMVSYKNTLTEYKKGLSSFKENKKFLISERKKEIEKAKSEAHNEAQGLLYALNHKHGLEKVKILNNFKDDKVLCKVKISELKNNYRIEKDSIKGREKQAKKLIKERIAQIKTQYKEKLINNKSENANKKSELRKKYIPLIKERKIAYTERCKKAKVEVKEYANQLKKQYLDSLAELEDKRDTNLDYAKEQFAIDKQALKDKYISSIKITKKEAKQKAIAIMREVGISEPEKRFKQYPFEFSGGMRQRIVIAIALTADPDIIICDEPTTALDVTIQAQILELINRLKKERNMSCIFITHDLGVVANMADRVAVMYAGKIVEYGLEEEIFYNPKHPYTWALLSSIPDVDSKEKLEAIPGTPPNMIYPPVGDAFALRSKYAMAIDFKKEPPFFKVSDTHYAATWLLDPRAPKVNMPKIVEERIKHSLEKNKKVGVTNEK